MNAKLPPFIRSQSDINFRPSRPMEHHIRIYLIPLAIGFFFLLFAARLFHLTVVKGTYYQFIAENNRIREVPLQGERGTIYDRKGRRISYDTKSTSPAKDPFQRLYPGGPALAHILGYRQIASEKHLLHDACEEPLRINDRVGIQGVEALYECHLRAIKGKRLVEIDATGKAIRTISQVEPQSGKSLKLSIDSALQEKAYEIIDTNAITTGVKVDLTKKRVAVIGLDPQTGEILLLLSYPSYDPENFEKGSKKSAQYFTDKAKPLFDRALLGTYPPGSVFKPFVAAGALEEEAITEDETVQDNGYIQAGPIRFHNWFYNQYGKTDGAVDLRKGLQRSNDIYFYTIGERMTPEHIKKWAGTFGFGKSTGIAFPEASGLIPTDFWKRETIGEKWYLGDTYNLSIGQGYLLTTPLQVAHASAAFANGGKLCKPQILRLDASENEDILESSEPDCTDLGLSPKTITAVREGMRKACQTGGTGWPFFNFGVPAGKSASDSARIDVGCKTGTAQSHRPHADPHAWFTVFAPYDKPEILLTVMVEEGGEGSNVAAPIAKEILKEYFDL